MHSLVTSLSPCQAVNRLISRIYFSIVLAQRSSIRSCLEKADSWGEVMICRFIMIPPITIKLDCKPRKKWKTRLFPVQ